MGKVSCKCYRRISFWIIKKISFTQGGVCTYKKHFIENENKYSANDFDGYVGWAGYGGSTLQWHPKLKIGFGYNPFYHNTVDLTNT